MFVSTWAVVFRWNIADRNILCCRWNQPTWLLVTSENFEKCFLTAFIPEIWLFDREFIGVLDLVARYITHKMLFKPEIHERDCFKNHFFWIVCLNYFHGVAHFNESSPDDGRSCIFHEIEISPPENSHAIGQWSSFNWWAMEILLFIYDESLFFFCLLKEYIYIYVNIVLNWRSRFHFSTRHFLEGQRFVSQQNDDVEGKQTKLIVWEL